MSAFSSVKKFVSDFRAAKKYVDSIADLPPTYHFEDRNAKRGVPTPQFFPDPISDEVLKKKLDYSDKCEKEWLERNKK